jgi:hypothetical protein
LLVSSDLACQLLRRFGSAIDEVRDAELREASDSACDVACIYDLEYADVRRQSLRLSGHSLFTWI